MKKNMKYLYITTWAAVTSMSVNAASQYWRGTAENPVWDKTTANWAATSTDTSRTTYQNDTSWSQPHFDGDGAPDITVASGGVLAYVMNLVGGSYTLSGGAVTAKVMDLKGGDLTIYNVVSNAIDRSSSSFGFRPRAGGSTVAVGSGGMLFAQISPQSDSTLDTKLVVRSNGTLAAYFVENNIQNNRFTLYFDGGMLKHLDQAARTFVNSKFILGAGGLHFRDGDGVSSGDSQYLPGPVLTDINLNTDGGVWIDEHSSYMNLPSNQDSTYRGGVHIDSSGGYLAARTDSSFGAVPASPANNIFFLKNNAKLVAHGSDGKLAINPNRNMFIADGAMARLLTYSGSRFSMEVQGTIGCENTQNGLVVTESYYGIDDTGVIAFCPTDGRTNHIGRLRVKAPTVIGSGTTLLESSVKENNGVNDDCPLNISSHGHLMVTGGVLQTTVQRHVCQNAKMTVSGGTADFSAIGSGCQFLHGYDAPATTTIKGNGRMVVTSLRMDGGNKDYNTDAANSVMNLETGGVLRVNGKMYIAGSGRKGTLNFNGGMLEWNNASSEYLEGWNNEQEYTRSGLVVNVMKGGMIVTNDYTFYTGVSVLSGTEHDGGLTKWGAGTFALVGTNTFNGPLAIMQGTYVLGGANLLNSNIAVRVNVGATFNMNTRSQGIARLEGSGTIRGANKGDENLYVSKAIAPGMGVDSLGTLTVRDDVCRIADDVALEIDVDTEGNSDRLNYPIAIDLSKMTLKINDLAKLSHKNGSGKKNVYTIATLNGGIVDNALFKSTNLPGNWAVCYVASSHELKVVPIKGMMLSFK